jgi:pimeloyl-ACP methyl ester carboxylesterase
MVCCLLFFYWLGEVGPLNSPQGDLPKIRLSKRLSKKMNSTNKNIIYEKANINYSIYGIGKAVVLIHGFAEDSSIWNAQIEFLQNDFLLIVPDIPGSGKSDLIQKQHVQISDYAEIIKYILDQEKITTCTMLGHSMGGYITLAFAEKYSERLTALGLIHSSAYADDEAKIETRKKAITFIQQNGSQAFLKTAIPNLFYDVEKSKKDIAILIEKGNNFSPQALIQYYEAMIGRPDRTNVLKTFSKPILFIIGEHDKAVQFAHSLQQTHLPSIAYIHILRNSAHMSMREETENVNKTLAGFLQY